MATETDLNVDHLITRLLEGRFLEPHILNNILLEPLYQFVFSAGMPPGEDGADVGERDQGAVPQVPRNLPLPTDPART